MITRASVALFIFLIQTKNMYDCLTKIFLAQKCFLSTSELLRIKRAEQTSDGLKSEIKKYLTLVRKLPSLENLGLVIEFLFSGFVMFFVCSKKFI